MNHAIYLIASIYFSTALLLMIYGLNCYIMIFLFSRKEKQNRLDHQVLIEDYSWKEKSEGLPWVTTQIAIFNEYNVAERVLRAACNIRYPNHEIQVLDDSTDETCNLVDQLVAEMNSEGHDIKVIRRTDRSGFKAGALAEGLKIARGEYVAIFDADFIPGAGFLEETLPYFLESPEVGLVQARWGHLNDHSSLLTKAQSIGIDGHFMVEQGGRAWNNLFMNFNGTAGVWRKASIEDAGGWSWDTWQMVPAAHFHLDHRHDFDDGYTVHHPP